MTLSAEAVLEGLTAPQREAATTIDGPLLVLAGAGSGKTRTITRRIAYMVACGIPSWNILAITFTNKAAGEMRQRVNALLGGEGSRLAGAVTVATFHSLCARLLRQFAEPAGLARTFSIFDTSDQTRVIKQAIKDCALSTDNFQPGAVAAAISKAKNKLQTPAAYAAAAGGFFEKNVARVYAKYEALLRESNAVDFDDLLLKTAILLRDNAAVRKELEERYLYVLIDEYQDTNHAQFIIAHMLAMNHKNICATGDPDQSIYGWRGASLKNILEFEEFYPNAKVVLLEQNYRSTKVILQAASALIANNAKRKKKALWTENEAGENITILRTNDEHQEATEIVRRLKEYHDRQGLPWDRFAVFYRVNSLSRNLEDALMKAAIPYQIARGTEFYARKEIKDVLAYLRVIANPGDNVSLERIINVPARALGDSSVARVQHYASQQGLSLLEACGAAEKVEGLTPRAVKACRRLAELFASWRGGGAAGAMEGAGGAEAAPPEDSLEAALAGGLSETPDALGPMPAEPAVAAPAGGGVRGLMERVYRESGMEAEFKKSDDPDNEKGANVSELITVAAEFDAQNPGGMVEEYLQQVTLVSDVDKIQDGGGAVTLMTLHAAKGLEFPWVAIAGMEDGLIPHARSIGFGGDDDELEEERRLAFVGITRAMRCLTLSYARYRTIRGMQERTVASQFLKEMPAECFTEADLTGEEESFGSVNYRDGAGQAWRAQSQRRREAEEQREEAQSTVAGFRRGNLVRHPHFGLGRVEEISPQSGGVRAVIQFQGGAGRKILIMPPARLERVDT